MSELSKTRININNSLKNNNLPSTQKIKSFHYVDDIKEKSKCNKKMSELSKTRINSNRSLKNNNVLSTQKKRSLHYVDSIKVKNNKKIKQEQNKYKTETKNKIKEENSATTFFKRIFFGRHVSPGKENNNSNNNNNIKKSNNIGSENVNLTEIEKEKYENEIFELNRQCQIYENHLKNLSSINRLLTDRNMELLNSNKKLEFLLEANNKENFNENGIHNSRIEFKKNNLNENTTSTTTTTTTTTTNNNNNNSNIDSNDVEKSTSNDDNAKLIQKQNIIIKTLNDTIKCYQITVEQQKKDLEFYQLNCTCLKEKNEKKNFVPTGNEEAKELYLQHLIISKKKLNEQRKQN
ncbi:hypothetical protein LY90DRAFT_103418 [Neocallimastix californiae]|uniref:Uncharacterized protein n=1 Tax=Neocallimastix californiae TaxID=1754190 RepID=A0A1Y2AVG2_9FUNG|nr:hypothetical protein LY90DRAFT_103418 [Neocallimastix californiae]|eukprot:ORY26561.1 hypothetical protein LY90DRAFT_103418 [Neocallimastix californiae]